MNAKGPVHSKAGRNTPSRSKLLLETGVSSCSRSAGHAVRDLSGVGFVNPGTATCREPIPHA